MKKALFYINTVLFALGNLYFVLFYFLSGSQLAVYNDFPKIIESISKPFAALDNNFTNMLWLSDNSLAFIAGALVLLAVVSITTLVLLKKNLSKRTVALIFAAPLLPIVSLIFTFVLDDLAMSEANPLLSYFLAVLFGIAILAYSVATAVITVKDNK